MSDPKRCEPADTQRDGWHWVRSPHKTVRCAYWSGDIHSWTNIIGTGNASHAYFMGYRYICPVPSPAEIAALVAAARDIANNVHARIAVAQHKMAKLDAALAPFQPKDTPHA